MHRSVIDNNNNHNNLLLLLRLYFIANEFNSNVSHEYTRSIKWKKKRSRKTVVAVRTKFTCYCSIAASIVQAYSKFEGTRRKSLLCDIKITIGKKVYKKDRPIGLLLRQMLRYIKMEIKRPINMSEQDAIFGKTYTATE